MQWHGFRLSSIVRRAEIGTLALIVLTLTLASILYLLFAINRVVAFRQRRDMVGVHQQPVTVLKPVCGLEPDLYENLSSFCKQEYSAYQVVFGVRDSNDPAIAVIKHVMSEFPERDLALVIDDRIIGTNLKISNLANMYHAVKYDTLVIADSDMYVGQDYLKAVVAPFEDSRMGAVTCLYKGAAVGRLPSVLGAMFINDWFVPSVLVALAFQPLRFCFGATMAVRRDALESIGGFAALVDHIADDHMLGKMVSALGFKVHLSSYVVENKVLEPSFKALFYHELRWARTIRSLQPVGYAFSFVTNGLPLALLLLWISPNMTLSLALLASVVLLRILLHYKTHASLRAPGPAMPWLTPVRDLLCFVVWVASFMGREVRWREQKLYIQSDGHMTVKRSI